MASAKRKVPSKSVHAVATPFIAAESVKKRIGQHTNRTVPRNLKWRHQKVQACDLTDLKAVVHTDRYVDEIVKAGWFNPVMMEPDSPKVVLQQQRGCKKIMIDFSDLEAAVGSMVKGDVKIKHPLVEKVCE